MVLKQLFCDNNQLTSLPEIPEGLEVLYCNNNRLLALPALPNSLESLNCSNNQLTIFNFHLIFNFPISKH